MTGIGEYHKLKISKMASFGALLESGSESEGDLILLPKKEVTEDLEIGQEIEVFIYRDSEDRITATLKEPFVKLGEVAMLKVKETTQIGAFLDWGLDKDLFLPFKEQLYQIGVGKSYLVAVYLDKSDRLCATTNVYKYLSSNSPYQRNDWAEGTVYKVREDIGALVAVDNMYRGLVPPNEIFMKIRCGDKIKVRVIRVRDDGKLDLSLREPVYKQIEKDAEIIMDKLADNYNYLEVNDKSSPAEITKKLNMSKSAFKNALGKLLKEKKVRQTQDGITLDIQEISQ